MFSFFQGPEVHPEAKSIQQYYDDIKAAVSAVRVEIADADQDPGFKQAAGVLEQVADICREMEVVSALECQSLNGQRKKLMPGIGDNYAINVTGEASKLLAQKYIALLEATNRKEYWPVETCPTLLGQSFLTEFAKGFERRKQGSEATIGILNSRIAIYDKSQQLVA